MKRKYAIEAGDELKQAEVIRQAAGRLNGILAAIAEHQGAWPMQSLLNDLNRTLDDIDELSNAIRFTVAVKAELLRSGSKQK